MGVCPECGSARAVAEFLADTREREALAAALRIDPRLAEPLLDYLALFAPPGRKIQTRKLVRLLTELCELLAPAQVTRNGVTCPAPVDYWRRAMEEMVTRRGGLTLPLSGHGYLQTVVFGLASKAGAVAERRAEEALRTRIGSDGPVQAGAIAADNAKPQRSAPPPGWKDALTKGGNHA
jgi:hypothetical protein